MSEFPIRVSPVPTEEYLKLKQQSENEVKKSSDHLQLFVSQPQHLSIPPMQPYLITSAEHTKPPNFPPHLASTDEYLKLNQGLKKPELREKIYIVCNWQKKI